MNDEEVYLLFKKMVFKTKEIRVQDKMDALNELYLRYVRRKMKFDNAHQVLGYAYKSMKGIVMKIYKMYYANGRNAVVCNIDDVGDLESDRDILAEIFSRMELEYKEVLEKLLVDKYTWNELKEQGISNRQGFNAYNELRAKKDRVMEIVND